MRPLSFFSFLFISSQAFAFPCYFTIAKDNCWTNYDLKVSIVDAETRKVLTTIEVPKGKSWTRQKFSCTPSQKISYQATFEPAFWQSEAGKVYLSRRYWSFPSTISPNESAWDIPICYASAFSEVPFPPDATTANCQCDFKNIPAIKAKNTK